MSKINNNLIIHTEIMTYDDVEQLLKIYSKENYTAKEALKDFKETRKRLKLSEGEK